MKKIKNITLVLVLLLSFISCKKEEITNKDNTQGSGSVKISFDYVWGSSEEPFTLNTTLTHPRTLKRIKFNECRLIISNIKFKDSYSDWTELDEKYYDISPQYNSILIENIPVGNYTEMTYTVGLDSIAQYNMGNSSIAGCIYNHGCVYAIISGSSESLLPYNTNFFYHFRGFNLSTVKTTDFNGNIIEVFNNNTSEIQMVVNPSYLWNTNDNIQINGRLDVFTNNEYVKIVSEDFISSIKYKN